MQIYNEEITDLLNPVDKKKLKVREDVQKGFYVEDLTEREIHSADDAIAALETGSVHRYEFFLSHYFYG